MRTIADRLLMGVIYLGWAVVIAALAFWLTGCAMSGSVPPDTLCSMPRPSWSSLDSEATRKAQAKAAQLWNSRCTVQGIFGR